MENDIENEYSLLDCALDAARDGFFVFPLAQGSKLPAIMDFAARATRDPKQIKTWWICPVTGLEQPFNIGIYCGRFGYDPKESLLVIDIDNKNGKKGSDEIFMLEVRGDELPETRSQITPNGGEHRIYRTKQALGNSAGRLGKGLDTRGIGGFIAGFGSSTEAGVYTTSYGDVAVAPEWICEHLRSVTQPKPAKASKIDERVDRTSANARARHYLESEADHAKEGASGDLVTFKVAACVKDFGVTQDDCVFLMDTLWNHKCEPPWLYNDLEKKVGNAYAYGKETVGARAPEVEFAETLEATSDDKKTLHPILEINKDHAFIAAAGSGLVLWETTESDGSFKLKHMNPFAFHQKMANKLLSLGNGKTTPVSELWMRSPQRRQYNDICFMPGQTSPDDFYNLWRGFAVKPLAVGEIPNEVAKTSVGQFLDHAFENVCDRNDELFVWLMTYFAHLVQRPYEKPLTAIVMKGQKGTGKNALIDRVGHLLGGHYLLASNRRYLTGNFNSHLENCLLFTLDEAFWSGDKPSEGTLKDLITGNRHIVERKGCEPYTVRNCLRVCIIGNEKWIVPASVDERRFAVFNVGHEKKQNNGFFDSMREGMERGGSAYLLRYLLDYSLANADLNKPPKTKGLLEQKIASLDPFYKWWYECLSIGSISNGDFGDGWPTEIERTDLHNAFNRYLRNLQIRSWSPDSRVVGDMMKECLPEISLKRPKREDGSRPRVYAIPPLLEARAAWEKYVGHECTWEVD